MLPRDLFINEIIRGVEKGKDVYFLCADLGAKSLDVFREKFPDRFIHMGICEQNMIDVAAGLSQNEKQVFVYAMGSFVTLRCLEQIKVALCCMKLPVTILGVGPGYGYTDAGPTHNPVEDIAIMRSMGGLEIYSPGDSEMVSEVARHCLESPALRYVRLERGELPFIDHRNSGGFSSEGFQCLRSGKDVLLLSESYMLQKATILAERLEHSGKTVTVLDLYRVKPINSHRILNYIRSHGTVAVLEEQFMSGGLSSALLEFMNDNGVSQKILRFALEEEYYFDNGGRDHLLELSGVGDESIYRRIIESVEGH